MTKTGLNRSAKVKSFIVMGIELGFIAQSACGLVTSFADCLSKPEADILV